MAIDLNTLPYSPRVFATSSVWDGISAHPHIRRLADENVRTTAKLKQED